MSLVYIIHHNENVRDFDAKAEKIRQYQSTKFVSKYKNMVKTQIHHPYVTEGPDGSKLLTDSGKHERRTMGCAQTPLNPPNQFLRKRQGVKWRRLHDHICPKGPGLPEIPKPTPPPCRPAREPKKESKKDTKELKKDIKKTESSKPQCKEKRKNFLALNVKRIKESETRRPPPHYVDTPTGQRHNLINSGLIPQHVCGKNFAKIPCYINRNKKMLEKYKRICATEMNAMPECAKVMNKYGVRKMTMEERVSILEGIKANFTEQMKIFQTLSLYTDTLPKQLRKGRIEKDLLQMEKDITFLENNPTIYISDF